jgi:uncharacterized protein
MRPSVMNSLSKTRTYFLLFHLTFGIFLVYPALFLDLVQTFELAIIAADRIDLLYAATLTLTTMAIAHPMLQASWKAFKKQALENVLLTVKTFFWMIGLSVLINIMVNALTGMNQSQNQNTIIDIYRTYPNLVIFQALIYAPLVEEILFRGLFFHMFAQKSVRVGIILSSVLFSVSHVMQALFIGQLQDLWFLPTYFILGVMLNMAYVRSKSLHVSIFAHFLNNLIGLWALAQLL